VIRIPVEDDAKTALYRSLLAGKRMLVLLDNAVAADQVRGLLPGGGRCLVLVTSRNRLSGLVARNGAKRLTLGLLTPAEAAELLAGVVGRERLAADPDAAGQLARLCGYLPLALRVAAERVSSRPAFTLGELVSDLANERDRLDLLGVDDDETASVRAVLSWSYHALKPGLAQAFRRLGLHPGPDISIPAAAALLGVPVKHAGSLLEALAGRHLIEHAGAKRYRLHDLLRLYATEVAHAEESPADHAATTRRVLNWYLHASAAARSLSAPGATSLPLDELDPHSPPLTFGTAEEAFAWYEVEAANLIAATQRAADSGNHDLAWKQALGTFSYFYSSGLLTAWVSVLQLGLRSAAELQDLYAHARLLNHLRVACSRLGRNDEAVDCLQRGLAMVEETGESELRSSLLGNLGSTLREMGRYEEGLSYGHQALHLARATQNRYYGLSALDTLCEIYVAWGSSAEALDYGQQGLAIAQDSGNELLAANLLINLGHAHRDLGRTAEARRHYEQALDLCRAITDRYHEALTLFGIAELHHRTGKFDLARETAELALQIFNDIDAEEAVAISPDVALKW
jgi:tetratricopeptide (TPR) repeat protein